MRICSRKNLVLLVGLAVCCAFASVAGAVPIIPDQAASIFAEQPLVDPNVPLDVRSAIFYPGSLGIAVPSTTSLANPVEMTDAEAALNYDESPVSDAIEPGSVRLEIQVDTDYFATVIVSFHAIVSELAATGINLTNETQLQFISDLRSNPIR